MSAVRMDGKALSAKVRGSILAETEEQKKQGELLVGSHLLFPFCYFLLFCFSFFSVFSAGFCRLSSTRAISIIA